MHSTWIWSFDILMVQYIFVNILSLFIHFLFQTINIWHSRIQDLRYRMHSLCRQCVSMNISWSGFSLCIVRSLIASKILSSSHSSLAIILEERRCFMKIIIDHKTKSSTCFTWSGKEPEASHLRASLVVQHLIFKWDFFKKIFSQVQPDS